MSTRPEREHRRFAHETAVTLRIWEKIHHGRTTNMSRGGLCVTLADPVELGTDLEIDVQLVFEDDVQSEPLRLPARVMWCTTLDEAYQIGVAFRPLDAERTELLTIFLRYLDDGKVAKTKNPDASIDERFG